MTRDDRLRIAVFIDFDNIEIGVKNTLNASFDAGLVLEALKERGEVVSKTAYSDWQRAGGYSRSLTQHAIKMVQRNLTPGGDKNGADINLALDALEMAFTHPHINAFVIVGGDSDFISLVEKLKQYDKKVFVVGGRQFTSAIMQRNCHEFVAYENLLGASGGGRRQAERGGVRVERVPIEQAIPLVARGLKVLADREVSPQLGLLKSTLLQLDSTFSERSYGAGSFRDFVEKLEKIGLVTLKEVKGSLLVSATEAAEGVTGPAEETEAADPHGSQNGSAAREPEAESGSPRDPLVAVVGSQAEGLQEFRRILSTGEVRRWPMYLRNVKQLIRQVSAEFDERAYGFANLVDLLRAAGRENLVRVDRDRQGVIRVFQGATTESEAPAKKIFDIEDELAEEAARATSADEDSSSVESEDADQEMDAPAAGAATETALETALSDSDEVDEPAADAHEESAPTVSEAAEQPSLPVHDTDEDPDEPNFNRPGAGGEDGHLAPSKVRRRPSTRRPAAAGGASARKGSGTSRSRTSNSRSKAAAAATPRAPRAPRARKSAKKS